MRGIILAGGHGTRLRPATKAMNKHMVPILNKPMILYPLETLKTLGVEDIMIVTGGNHVGAFADFLGDGSEYGVSLTYRVQKDAGGIAQALALGERFAAGDKLAVILGDNVFDNETLSFIQTNDETCTIYVKEVEDPERFGVYYGTHIEEKPTNPASNLAVVGLYIYPSDVFDVVKTLKPSNRGELEITDVNNFYLKDGRFVILKVDGFWSDAGTPESMHTVTDWAYSNNK